MASLTSHSFLPWVTSQIQTLEEESCTSENIVTFNSIILKIHSLIVEQPFKNSFINSGNSFLCCAAFYFDANTVANSCSHFLSNQSPIRKVFTLPIVSRVLFMFSSSRFKVLGLTFRFLIHFQLIFVQGKRQHNETPLFSQYTLTKKRKNNFKKSVILSTGTVAHA